MSIYVFLFNVRSAAYLAAKTSRRMITFDQSFGSTQAREEPCRLLVVVYAVTWDEGRTNKCETYLRF